jgi:multicomponent K+:H+ antiporter subunit A
MAGVPLMNGFLSKEMFFQQAVEMSNADSMAWMIPVLVTIGGVFSVAYSIRFIHDVFFNGEPIGLTKTPHEPPRFMKIPVDILVIVCLAVGIFPAYTVAPILQVAVMGTLQTTAPAYSLAIWHGFNYPLMMSFIAMAVGVLVYFRRERFFAFYKRYFRRINAKRYFNFWLQKLFNASIRVTRSFDKGSLQNASAWIIGASLVIGAYGFLAYPGALFGDRALLPLDGVTLVVALGLMIISLLTMVWHRQRLLTLIVIGVIGLVISLGFVKFSAPDLALTQLSVEVVTIVLLLLALYFLPQYTPRQAGRLRLWRDGLLAAFAGIGVTLFTLSVLTRDYSTIAEYFLANSVPGGGGTNVVNVILVDFRGFDTLGEIVVLALAGLGVFAMLEGMKLPAPKNDIEGRLWNTDKHPLIMQTLTRLLLPLMLLVAVFIFLRGHNLPGGGFIAGLIASVALIVQYLANGIQWTSQRIKVDMHWSIGVGLLIAISTGLVAMGLGYPFLTSAFTHLHWPVVGEFEVASAIAFDLGVFLVVVGATVMSLVQLGKLSYASHHPNDPTANPVSQEVK